MSGDATRLSAKGWRDIQALIPSGFRELPFAAYSSFGSRALRRAACGSLRCFRW